MAALFAFLAVAVLVILSRYVRIARFKKRSNAIHAGIGDPAYVHRQQQDYHAQFRKFESNLANELGVAFVPQMQVVQGVPADSVLPGLGPLQAGLAYGYLRLGAPRPFEFILHAISQTKVLPIWAMMSITLNRPVHGAVNLATRGMSLVFEGDPETAARLNADRSLVRQAANVPVTTSRNSKNVMRIPLYVTVRPLSATHSVLTVRTLPLTRMTTLGYRTREALALADAIEARL